MQPGPWSAYYLYGKSGNSGEKVIPSDILPFFPRFYQNERNFLNHLFGLSVPGFLQKLQMAQHNPIPVFGEKKKYQTNTI